MSEHDVKVDVATSFVTIAFGIMLGLAMAAGLMSHCDLAIPMRVQIVQPDTVTAEVAE